MSSKVAVVTGANKGIGYGIVKELCERGVEIVYLTARDVSRGTEAVNSLKKEGLHPKFYQLEVTDDKCVESFGEYLKVEHGGLDILINNAAVFVSDLYKVTYEEARTIIDINYRSNLIIQKYLFPILKDNARVVNISSDCGLISNLNNQHWIDRLIKKDIKINDINDFVDWFLDSVKNDNLKEEDFTVTEALAYKVSKIALCALTRAQQNEVGRGISINSIHPGFVKTDATKNVGYLTIHEAAKAPVYLALDINQSVKGRFFWFDKTEKEWADPKAEYYTKAELEEMIGMILQAS